MKKIFYNNKYIFFFHSLLVLIQKILQIPVKQIISPQKWTAFDSNKPTFSLLNRITNSNPE